MPTIEWRVVKWTRHFAPSSGDLLTMHDDRSVPTINNEKINYNPDMAYDSRCIKSKWDSGLVEISAAEIETILDFKIKEEVLR